MLDLPQDAFLLAGRAWQLYRSKLVNPIDFGISSSGPRGVAFIIPSPGNDVTKQ